MRRTAAVTFLVEEMNSLYAVCREERQRVRRRQLCRHASLGGERKPRKRHSKDGYRHEGSVRSSTLICSWHAELRLTAKAKRKMANTRQTMTSEATGELYSK
jgi:hypothetical protein